ncbi:MAG: hypothetical protein HYR90_03325 [Candidatus Andersenbacteria bacterium]|nr:hypothetical protein [Candidatus Andersenbacteria bacterium]MBI3250296.1 hypothetical protein [Candidatus Andersenbacteria bacterium]
MFCNSTFQLITASVLPHKKRQVWVSRLPAPQAIRFGDHAFLYLSDRQEIQFSWENPSQYVPVGRFQEVIFARPLEYPEVLYVEGYYPADFLITPTGTTRGGWEDLIEAAVTSIDRWALASESN